MKKVTTRAARRKSDNIRGRSSEGIGQMWHEVAVKDTQCCLLCVSEENNIDHLLTSR